MNNDTFPGLDFDFLRYIGVNSESQRRIQSFYLPLFKDHHQVIDLGCGDGDFVALLAERGINIVGVDSDEKAYREAAARGLPVAHSDVFDYLRELTAESVDGIFCAHLVEHLPYPKVIELVCQSFRVLRPGGVVVLATPNVRTLFSHLEMFYLHFGHVSFYHPRLLCFFLEHEGFGNVQSGENPETASPLLAEILGLGANRLEFEAGFELSDKQIVASAQPRGGSPAAADSSQDASGPITGRPDAGTQKGDPLRRLSSRVRRPLKRLVLPLLNELAANLNDTRVARDDRQQIQAALEQEIDARRIQVSSLEKELHRLRGDVRTLADSLQSLNGAFECYATALKPEPSQASAK
jgi:SAM-dependent methyltransferase